MSKNITNKIAIIAILLISFFGMNLEESKGQNPCPTGFSTDSLRINAGGCEYDIWVCYECNPTNGQSAVFIRHYAEVDTNCSGGLTEQQKLNNINNWLKNPNNNRQFCDKTLPPCGVSTMQVAIYEPICWYYVYLAGRVYTAICLENEAYCLTVYEYCYNPLTLQITTTISYGPSISGFPNCTIESLEIDKDTINENNPYSDCFHFEDNTCEYNP
jgi:hypothetical protein